MTAELRQQAEQDEIIDAVRRLVAERDRLNRDLTALREAAQGGLAYVGRSKEHEASAIDWYTVAFRLEGYLRAISEGLTTPAPSVSEETE